MIKKNYKKITEKMLTYQTFIITLGGGTLNTSGYCVKQKSSLPHIVFRFWCVQPVTSSSQMIMKSHIPCETLSKIFWNQIN